MSLNTESLLQPPSGRAVEPGKADRMATELRNEFPIGILTPALEAFQPPQGDFAPDGEWRQRWAQYSIGQRGQSRCGEVVLARKRSSEGAVLTLAYSKGLPGSYRLDASAEIHCRADALATPVRWRARSDTLGPDHRPLSGTAIAKTGEVKGPTITIADPQSTRTIQTPAAFTCNWALLDAVQRLPRDPFKPQLFTLLDDFDVVKANHSLTYRGAVETLLGGKRVQKQRWEELEKGRIRKTTWGREGDTPALLHVYDHLGDGIVPEVYYVDEAGRLLFLVAGIEAYVWEPPQ